MLQCCGQSFCCTCRQARCVRCDSEGSTKAILDRVVADMGDKIIPENTPKHSSASNLAEAAVKASRGACSCFADSSGHAPWYACDNKCCALASAVPARSVTLHGRTAVRQSPFECAFGRPFRRDAARFCEALLFFSPHPHHCHLAKNCSLHKGEAK